MLEFGWRANEIRESAWYADPAFCDISTAAMDAWREDGDATHLEPFALHGRPTKITYRNLTSDETRVVTAYSADALNPTESYARAVLAAFRIGVDFPGREKQRTSDGVEHAVIVKERGVRMLAEPFVHQLEKTYPGIVAFYGTKILLGSITTETEKKASSPPSTQTPSSAAESTEATMAAYPSAAGA